MARCANQYLALSISNPPDSKLIASVSAPTSVSFYFNPAYSPENDNPYSRLIKDDINLSTTPSLSQTTISENISSDIYTLSSVKLIAPTFRTYNLPNNVIVGELVFYFQGTQSITGYHVVVPIYKTNYDWTFKNINNIRYLFPDSLEYVQYPYCDAKNNYYVVYLYKGINMNIPLQTTVDNNINSSSMPWSQNNSLFTYYKSIAPATKKPLNTTNKFTVVEFNKSTDIQGNYVVVDPSNGKRLDDVLTEVNAAQAAALNNNGFALIYYIFIYLCLTIITIIVVLIIYYIWRWVNDDFNPVASVADGVKMVVEKVV